MAGCSDEDFAERVVYMSGKEFSNILHNPDNNELRGPKALMERLLNHQVVIKYG